MLPQRAIAKLFIKLFRRIWIHSSWNSSPMGFQLTIDETLRAHVSKFKGHHVFAFFIAGTKWCHASLMSGLREMFSKGAQAATLFHCITRRLLPCLWQRYEHCNGQLFRPNSRAGVFFHLRHKRSPTIWILHCSLTLFAEWPFWSRYVKDYIIPVWYNFVSKVVFSLIQRPERTKSTFSQVYWLERARELIFAGYESKRTLVANKESTRLHAVNFANVCQIFSSIVIGILHRSESTFSHKWHKISIVSYQN